MNRHFSEPWCNQWFNSPYYHLLYKERDEGEAELFASRLLIKLHPAPQSEMLDLACGKGRYSTFLHSQGHRVTGIDFSEPSIHHCRKMECSTMKFAVHDMRQSLHPKKFDYVFSFFTSFGYFEKDIENFNVLASVSDSLKPEGIFVLDFINRIFVEKNLVQSEKKMMQDVEFNITRTIESNFLLKKIFIVDKGRDYFFYEKVKLYDVQDFEQYFKKCGLSTEDLYGDYLLNNFDPESSERLILIARKHN